MKPLRLSILVLVYLCFSSCEVKAQWLASGLTSTSVNAFAVSGTNLFAATSGGVYLSTNKGTSWTKVNTGLDSSGIPYPTSALAASGTNLFAGTNHGVFLSTNNGTSWTRASAGLTTWNVLSLAVSGANIFAGIDNGGVYLSTNNGASWSSSSAPFVNYSVRALAVSGSSIYAGTDSGKVFRSNDNGNSWTLINVGWKWPKVLSLAAAGSNIYAGTYSSCILYTTDGGSSWSQTLPLSWVNSIVNAVLVVGSTVYAGTNGGIFVSADNAANWTQVDSGLTNTSIQSLVLSGSTIFAGTSNGVFQRSLSDFMTIVAPKPSATGITSPIRFIWNRRIQALTYAFQLSKDVGFSNPLINQYTTDTSYTVSSLDPATTYYWRVRAENANGASEWALSSFTTTLFNSVPQLVSPANGATLVSVTPTLQWNPLASAASHTMQLSTQASFNALTYSKDTTGTSIVLPPLQRGTLYYWRVRAQTLGDTSSWSNVYSFTTLPNGPAKIGLLYPDSAKQNAFQNDWLLWQRDSTAVSYHVDISPSPLFTVIFDSGEVRAAGYRNPNKPFLSGSTYFWRVRGSNVGGDGEYSSVWSFKVSSAIRAPITSYSSSIVDCGRVKVGQFKDTLLTVSNIGTDTLRIQNISSSSGVFIVRLTSKALAPEQSFVDTIRYAPTTIGMGTSDLIIRSNAASVSDTIKLSGFAFGQGVASIISSRIEAGRIQLGQSKDTTISISNSGNDTLRITSIVSSSAIFSIRVVNKTLLPGQLFVDTVRITPMGIGPINALIVLSSNSPSSPDTVELSGSCYGQGILLSSLSAISFGSVKVGQYKDTVLVLSNNGNDTLKISSITSSLSSYKVSQVSVNIPPGKSLFADTIRFMPATGGSLTGTISVVSNAVSSPDVITVSGFGSICRISLAPVWIDMGFVLVGEIKHAMFTLVNKGSDTLRVSEISTSISIPGLSLQSGSMVIPPSDSSRCDIHFAPTTIGAAKGIVLVVSNAVTSPDSVVLIVSGVSATTGVLGDHGIPHAYALSQNYPNPFNPTTIIKYAVPQSANVSLRIFNTLGQEVIQLVNEQKSPGYYHIEWNASVPSGIYFYRLQAGEFVETKKMILLK